MKLKLPCINFTQKKVARSTSRKNSTYELHKLLFLALFFPPDAHKTFERTRTLHNVHEHFQSVLSDGKLHCFRNNTGIRINISSLSASTLIRECVFFVLLFRYSKTEGYRVIRSRVLASKVSSFLLPRNPETREREREEDRKLC
jgi:hypothetical protein